MRAILHPSSFILLFCLPVSWPLLTIPFFASDDGLFHLYRVAALDEALKQGALYPRLFPSFAFGYGQAVLNYYGPLSYYAAESLHWLGADFPEAVRWTFALGYLASGGAAFLLARQFVSPWPALLGAVVYIYFPYHIADAYQRGALAEHLAFVFLPLVLWAMMRPSSRTSLAPLPNGVRGDFRLLSFILSLAALILTHSLTALIFLPFALLYYFVVSRNLGVGSWKYVPAARAARPPLAGQGCGFGLALAFGLTAFYWLPILTESRWVGLSAALDADGYRQHLAPLLGFVQPSLVFQYAPQQIVATDHPLGFVSFALLVVAMLMAIIRWRRDANRKPLLFFVLLSLAALFMTLDISLPLWRALHNPLTYLQYPWRFMTLVALGLAMSAALMTESSRRVSEETGKRGRAPLPYLLADSSARLLPFLLIPFLIVTSIAALPLRPLTDIQSDERAMWQNDFKQRQIGASWTAEYMPRWVRADRTAIPNALRTPASDVSLSAPELSLADAGYTYRRYRFACSTRDGSGVQLLRFHQFYLPQWRVTLDGQPLSTFPSTDLGLLSVEAPCHTPGDAALELDFAMTTAEQVGWLISLASLLVLGWRWRGRALPGLIIAGLLIGLVFWAQRVQPAPVQFAQDTRLADVAELVGVRFDRAAYRVGDSIRVTLTWLAQRETRENFKAFVHLMDASGARVIAQSDGDPVGGFTPTSRWRTGELVEDTRVLQIPRDAAPGKLRLYAGMYRFPSLQNLTTMDRDGRSFPDNRIPISEVDVVAR